MDISLGYEIVSYDIDDGHEMLVLASIGSRTFIDNLISSKRTADAGNLIIRNAKRVAEKGLAWAKASETLKPIDIELALYELKIKGKVIRVMTYIHEESTPVYLFDFRGHQGKTAHIDKSVLEKARRLALAAKECLGGEYHD